MEMVSMHCRQIAIFFAERLRQLAEEPDGGGVGGAQRAPHKMGCQRGW